MFKSVFEIVGVVERKRDYLSKGKYPKYRLNVAVLGRVHDISVNESQYGAVGEGQYVRVLGRIGSYASDRGSVAFLEATRVEVIEDDAKASAGGTAKPAAARA